MRSAADGGSPAGPTAVRMPRAQRREQILVAATEAFARGGFAATSLDDVANEAGITRMIVYAHFASKIVLYRAVLDRMRAKLDRAVGSAAGQPFSIDALLGVASAEPAGFRLLFHHAAREPEFRAEIDAMRRQAIEVARQFVGARIPQPAWSDWACSLIPTFTLEAVISWLDAGQPDPHDAASRIRHAIHGIIEAAQSAG